MPKKSRNTLELNNHISTLKDNKEFIVADLLPSRSVAILVGDSGLGKTPFCIHLAICCASGIPFLKLPTTQCDVLYADYENSGSGFADKRDDICHALNIPTPTNIYHIESPTIPELEHELDLLKPKLLIIDTLRLFDPLAESVLPEGAPRRMQWFRRMASRGTTILFIHHPKKQSDDPKQQRPPLSDLSARVIEWIRCSAGSLALINQSDVRIGFDRSHEPPQTRTYDAIIRAQRRGVNELGPWKLIRQLDEHSGDEVLYTVLEGTKQLSSQYTTWLSTLPTTPFTFSDAVTLLKTNKRFVSDFLKAAVLACLITRTGTHHETRYRVAVEVSSR